jgi:HEAT repeat protein
MSKRTGIVFGILLVAVLVMLSYELLRPRENLYQGKSIRVWLERSTAGGPMAAPDTNDLQAIRQFGASIVPTLLEMARAKDSPLKHAWIELVRALPVRPFHLHTDVEYHTMACTGFYALGPLGKDAVPDLVKLLDSTKGDPLSVAADCLGNIGPEANAAVPILISLINNPDRIVRWDTTVNLSKIHMRPELVVPVLITNLSPTNFSLSTTIHALGSFGDDAKPAVPILLTFLNSEKGIVREAVTNALKAIDPQAAAKAGIR